MLQQLVSLGIKEDKDIFKKKNSVSLFHLSLVYILPKEIECKKS